MSMFWYNSRHPLQLDPYADVHNIDIPGLYAIPRNVCRNNSGSVNQSSEHLSNDVCFVQIDEGSKHQREASWRAWH